MLKSLSVVTRIARRVLPLELVVKKSKLEAGLALVFLAFISPLGATNPMLMELKSTDVEPVDVMPPPLDTVLEKPAVVPDKPPVSVPPLRGK
jgi:hypothetical protein